MQKIIPVALGLLINGQGKFLITLRNDPGNPRAHMKWEIPGGGIEKGETVDQAIVRELKEEVGIEARLLPYPKITKTVVIQTRNPNFFIKLRLMVHLCKVEEGEIMLDKREAIDYRWVSLEELSSLPSLPRTDEIIEEAAGLLHKMS